MRTPAARRAPRLAALGLSLWLTAAVAAAAAGPVARIDRVGMTVSDLDRSLRFFTEVLPFEKVAEVEVDGAEVEHLEGVFGVRARIATLRLGEDVLELTEYLAPEGRPMPAGSRSNDGWFQHVAIVVRDVGEAYARLRAHRVRHASSGPQRLPDWNPNAGGIEAFYFKDPDGHVLEIIAFPPGKGDPGWRNAAGDVFLGIDHTAIVVADTEASLAFYRDALGLRVAGESENWGTEQEHLNNVFGARLRITALRAPAGPGIELLEYLAPRGGRPYPADARPNDLLHWQTDLRVTDAATLQALDRGLRRIRVRFVSPGVVALPEGMLGFTAGLLVRDPDGHAVRLVTDGAVEP